MQEFQQEQHDMEEIDLRDLLHILKIRWHLIALIFILAVSASSYVSFRVLDPVYKAETSLFVGKEGTGIGPINLGDLNLGQSLVSDYREIILSRMVAREAMDQLGLNMSVSNFQSRVSISTVRDARLFKIGFESTNPQEAMDVANTLGDIIIEKAEEIIEIRNVQIIDQAELPMNPIKPNKIMNVAIAGVLGIMLGVFLVFALEYLDRTIKNERDIERYLGLTLLGGIPLFVGDLRKGEGKKKKKGKKGKHTQKNWKGMKWEGFTRTLVSLNEPRSAAAEAFQSLRTSIRYASVDKEIKTLVVTSPSTRDGKTTVSTNLAVVLAQIGNRVLLLEGDLRKPKVHIHFNVLNEVGITDVIARGVPLEEVIKSVEGVENLDVICSGMLPPNSSVILESKKMKEVLQQLRDHYDMVILDTPPVGQITDAAIMSRMADGAILVLASGQTNIDMARHAMQSLKQVDANILGTVLTRINKKSSGAYYYRYYEYESYHTDKKDVKQTTAASF